MRPIERQGFTRKAISNNFESYSSKNDLIDITFEKNGNLSITTTETDNPKDTELTLEQIKAIYDTAYEIKKENKEEV